MRGWAWQKERRSLSLQSLQKICLGLQIILLKIITQLWGGVWVEARGMLWCLQKYDPCSWRQVCTIRCIRMSLTIYETSGMLTKFAEDLPGGLPVHYTALRENMTWGKRNSVISYQQQADCQSNKGPIDDILGQFGWLPPNLLCMSLDVKHNKCGIGLGELQIPKWVAISSVWQTKEIVGCSAHA